MSCISVKKGTQNQKSISLDKLTKNRRFSELREPKVHHFIKQFILPKPQGLITTKLQNIQKFIRSVKWKYVTSAIYISKTYIITLSRRAEKYHHAMSELRSTGFFTAENV